MPIILTPDEIINTVLHSNLKESGVTTVFMEDKLYRDKKGIEPYRFMQKQIGQNKVSFFSCQGKGNLMKVYERRAELKGIPILFLRDRDMYVYQSIPNEYSDLIFTTGYSIENDVYAYTSIEDLLDRQEKSMYEKAKHNFLLWYSSQIHLLLKGTETIYDFSPHHILNIDLSINEKYVPCESILHESKPLFNDIKENYFIKLRGHSLFALLILFIDAPKRSPRINYEKLLHYSINELSSPLLMKLILEIEERHNKIWNMSI